MSKAMQRIQVTDKRDICSQPADANTKSTQMISRPRSLTMGPSVVLDFVSGEEEAILIVNSWQPLFTCRLVSQQEFDSW
jgi:hypothetical protein